jgi:hypothetical protein
LTFVGEKRDRDHTQRQHVVRALHLDSRAPQYRYPAALGIGMRYLDAPRNSPCLGDAVKDAFVFVAVSTTIIWAYSHFWIGLGAMMVVLLREPATIPLAKRI